MGDRISVLDQEAGSLEADFREQLAGIPNLPQESVPIGKDANDNVEIRRFGTPRDFDFPPQPHWESRARARHSGFRTRCESYRRAFCFLLRFGSPAGARVNRLHAGCSHAGTRLHRNAAPVHCELSQLVWNRQSPQVRRRPVSGSKDTDYWLIPTAEVPVTNYYRDETLDSATLPISFCAATSCFRSEAGSYGRDVRGIIRQHQFQKVELVKFTTPEQSNEQHEKLTRDAEDILQRLGLPYRTVVLCTGDMGFSSSKTHDIEVWLPGQNAYKEISSCTNFEAFQARRANIRCKGPNAKKSEHLHTINGSGLAVGRTWVAILENYQQADGSVVIPEALRPYMGADVIEPVKG